MLRLRVGGTMDRDALLRKLVGMQYARNDLAFHPRHFPGTRRHHRDHSVYEELAVRIEMFGDESSG